MKSQKKKENIRKNVKTILIILLISFIWICIDLFLILNLENPDENTRMLLSFILICGFFLLIGSILALLSNVLYVLIRNYSKKHFPDLYNKWYNT